MKIVVKDLDSLGDILHMLVTKGLTFEALVSDGECHITLMGGY